MFIDQIKNLSHDNKYTRWYCDIVRIGQKRVDGYSKHRNKKKLANELLGYVEAHHIVPR